MSRLPKKKTPKKKSPGKKRPVRGSPRPPEIDSRKEAPTRLERERPDWVEDLPKGTWVD